jgi:hypothetical protein
VPSILTFFSCSPKRARSATIEVFNQLKKPSTTDTIGDGFLLIKCPHAGHFKILWVIPHSSERVSEKMRGKGK